MNPWALAIRAELERRGALRPDDAVEIMPPSSREKRLKAIQDELVRRGALGSEQTREESSPSLWTEIPEAVSKGALSGALKTGMGLAIADPVMQEAKLWMQTQDDLAPYADQHDEILKAGSEELAQRDEGTLKNLQNPLSRMAYHGGDWMGSGAVMPGGNALKGAKAVPALVKEVAKRLGLSLSKDAGMGATSGLLQEGDSSPLTADLMAPLAVAAGKKGLKSAKWAFSPNYRQKIALPQVTQELGGTLRETLDVPHDAKPSSILTPSGLKKAWQEIKRDLRDPKDALKDVPAVALKDQAYARASHEMNVPEHTKPLTSHQVSPDQAGKSVRQHLLNEIEALYRKRSEITDPLYQDLMSIQEGMEPVQARAAIAEKLKTAKGNTRSHLERAERELRANDQTPLERQSLTPEQQGTLSLYQDLLANAERHRFYDPKNPSAVILDLRQKIAALENKVSPSQQPKPAEIENALKWLGDEIAAARQGGQGHLARELSDVKRAGEKDLSALPQGTRYRTEYKALSEPINALEEHRTLGKIVGEKKNTYSQQHVLSDSEIPAKVIGTSLKSVDDAKELMKHLKGKQGGAVRQSLEGFINKSVLDFITDEQGKVSATKIHAWKKNHPGAFVLYPQLETKLQNLRNAQHFTDTFIAKSRNLPLLEAYQAVPSYLFKKIFRKTPLGAPVLEFLKKAVGAEKEALRQELVNKALKDPETARILMTPAREEGKIMQALQKASKGATKMTLRTQGMSDKDS